MPDDERIESAIAALATRQDGAIAYRQLRRLGLGEDAIEFWLEIDRLHRLFKGVYALGHEAITLRTRWWAATLACGDAAVLSHWDGGMLYSVLRSSSPIIHVSAPGRTRDGHRGLRLHLPRQLPPEDLTTHKGIPVTTLARVFIDLAPYLSLERLTRMWDDALRQDILDVKQIEAIRARSNGRKGLKKIDSLLAQTRDFPPRTRTELERDGYLLFAESPDVPTPSANVWIAEAALEADLVWAERVVVELDHDEWHAKTRQQRERDNDRDFRLQLAGYKVLRVSDFRLRTDREGILRDVGDLLRSQRPVVLAADRKQPLAAHLLQA
jgi:Protein of unknown function (DUF559)